MVQHGSQNKAIQKNMKLFEIKKPKSESKIEFKYILTYIIGTICFILLFITTIEIIVNHKHLNKMEEKPKSELIHKLIMNGGNILTQKVEYETSKKVDPDDTSNIYFEVCNAGNSKIPVGALVKFNHRFIQEQQIEGETYFLIDYSNIHFYIKPEDVNKSILKR